MIKALALALILIASPAIAQDRQPPIIDPRPTPPAQAPATPVSTMEDLVRQGYEVKAMEQYGGQAGQFLVILQRSGEVRTCLLRIERQPAAGPSRRTVCF